MKIAPPIAFLCPESLLHAIDTIACDNMMLRTDVLVLAIAKWVELMDQHQILQELELPEDEGQNLW